MRRLAGGALLALLLAAPAAAGENRISVRSDVHVAKGDSVDTAASLFGSVVVDGDVRDSAVSVFGDVTIGATGHVGGDAVSVGGAVYRVDGGSLGGKIRTVTAPGGVFTKLLLLGLPTAAATLALVGTFVAVVSSLGFIVLVALILLLFEAQVDLAGRFLREAPFRSLALGFLGFLASLPLAIFFTVTIIGIPIAIAGLSVFMAAICLGSVSVCEWLGGAVSARLERPMPAVWRGLLGLALLFLVGFVPVVGAVIHAVAVLAGLGAVMQSRFRAATR